MVEPGMQPVKMDLQRYETVLPLGTANSDGGCAFRLVLWFAYYKGMNEHASHYSRPEREWLTSWFNEAIALMQPSRRLRQTITRESDLLHYNAVKLLNLRSYRRIWLFGAGKGSISLAHGVAELLGDRLTGGVVIGPSGSDQYPLPGTIHLPENDGSIRLLPGNHPVPGEASLQSTNRMLDMATLVQSGDLVVFVLTGGASAMLCQPVDGLSLVQKQARFQRILASGASIHEMNAARKKWSKVKGGRLLEYFSGADVLNVVVSDVPGDDLRTIGSGPTQPDETHGYPGEVINCLIATPAQMAGVVGDLARAAGCEVHYDETAYSGPVERLGDRIVADLSTAMARRKEPAIAPPVVYLYYGESEVQVTGNGRGGRNQHLALYVASKASVSGGSFTLLSAGTDGIDGNTDAAGAICTEHTALMAQVAGLHPEEFLRNFDSHSFFRQIDDIFVTGPTGTNFADLQILIVH